LNSPANDLLTRLEAARLWSYFHKDWLLQLRQALREQLPADYRVFVESEAVLISPLDESPAAVVLPDVSVSRSTTLPFPHSPLAAASVTAAVIEAEEPCEVETHYVLVIRRAPEQHIVAAVELLSPSNKGIGNRFDRQQHLRKRGEYLHAGVSLLEIDALLQGDRDLPPPLVRLAAFERCAWTAHVADGKRRYAGWGWNSADPLPVLDWLIDAGQHATINLGQTFDAAVAFNDWKRMTMKK